jgi:preprotein translocase subunit SecA
MSLFESTLEGFRFRNSLLESDLQERATAIMARTAKLDRSLTNKEDVIGSFRNILSRYGDNTANAVNESAAFVCLACKRAFGKKWSIFSKDYRWELIPRDTQVQAGLILCDEIEENRFIRARTGEGKTLVGLFPIAYHSLYGSVHVVTCNDYLANRDQQWIGPILRELGIDSAFLSTEEEGKRECYNHLVLFGSDKEFTFDMLRDSIRSLEKKPCCEKREYVLVDEADHIMLDELETPVVLSGLTGEVDGTVAYADGLIEQLLANQKEEVEALTKKLLKGVGGYGDKRDFYVLLLRLKYSGLENGWLENYHEEHPDIQNKAEKFEAVYIDGKGFVEHIEPGLFFAADLEKQWIALTQKGMKLLEELCPELPGLFLIPDINLQEKTLLSKELSRYKYARELEKMRTEFRTRLHLIDLINNLLFAHLALKRDVDYIVTGDKIELITPSTGRGDPLKKYQRGISQALECKEDVKQTANDLIIASTTLTSFFGLYSRIGAMSGTITPNQKEIRSIYNIKCFDVPPFKPPLVKHFGPLVCNTESEKRESVINDVLFYNSFGRPVLVGTASIASSESLKTQLDERGIRCSVLNARHEKREAEIIAEAGKTFAVTVSTNMAGRGVDIPVSEEQNRQLAKHFVHLIARLLLDDRNVKVVSHTQPDHDLLREELAKQVDVLNCKVSGNKKRFRKIWVLMVSKNNGDNASQKAEVVNITFNTGLAVLGEETGDSERWMVQLAGRTGRQGNRGSSQFYYTPGEKLLRNSPFILFCLRRFGGKGRKSGNENVFTQFARGLLLKMAYIKSEKNAESRRREKLFYFNIAEEHRNRIQRFREWVLSDNFDLYESVYSAVMCILSDIINTSCESRQISKSEFDEALLKSGELFNTGTDGLKNSYKKVSHSNSWRDGLLKLLQDHVLSYYKNRKSGWNSFEQKKLGKKVLLDAVDRNRVDHLYDLEYLKDTAQLFGYSGKDPKALYVDLTSERFDACSLNTARDFLRDLFHSPLSNELSLGGKKGPVSHTIKELLL